MFSCRKRSIKSSPIQWLRHGCSATIRYDLYSNPILRYAKPFAFVFIHHFWHDFDSFFIFGMILLLLLYSVSFFNHCRNSGVYQNRWKKMRNTTFQLMNWSDLIHYCEMYLIREHAISFISEAVSCWSFSGGKMGPHRAQRCTFCIIGFSIALLLH